MLHPIQHDLRHSNAALYWARVYIGMLATTRRASAVARPRDELHYLTECEKCWVGASVALRVAVESGLISGASYEHLHRRLRQTREARISRSVAPVSACAPTQHSPSDADILSGLIARMCAPAPSERPAA